MVKNYGFKMAQQIKVDYPKQNDLLRFLIVKEINRAYKYPQAVRLNKIKLLVSGLPSFGFSGQGLRNC